MTPGVIWKIQESRIERQSWMLKKRTHKGKSSMAQQSSREEFEKKLRDAFFKKAIPIDQLTWQDVPDIACELTIACGDKKRIFALDNFALINDPDGQIEQIIDDLGDFT
jgi:hypothetical protein